MLLLQISFLFLSISVNSIPQAHGPANILMIALNQLSSSTSYSFSILETLLIDSITTNGFLTAVSTVAETLTFVAPTDDAFRAFLKQGNLNLSNSSQSLEFLQYHSIPYSIHFKDIQPNGFMAFPTKTKTDLKIGRDFNNTITLYSGFNQSTIVRRIYNLYPYQIFVVGATLTLPSFSLAETLKYYNQSVAAGFWRFTDSCNGRPKGSTSATNQTTYFIPSDSAMLKYAISINSSIPALLQNRTWILSFIANHTLSEISALYSISFYGPHRMKSNTSVTFGKLIHNGVGSYVISYQASSTLLTITNPDILIRGGVIHIIDGVL